MTRKAPKIVRRRIFNSALATNEDRFVEDVRGLVWAKSKDLTWKQMAAAANIGKTTVIKFASGDTRKPTFHTLYNLVVLCGGRLSVIRGVK